jgi:putative glutamine amidotransferase
LLAQIETNDGMTAAPLIGITTYGRDESNRFTLPGEYADAVRRAGAVPVLIPPGETQIERLLSTLDGLVLAGGGDINPELYGGTLHETIYNLDSERDKAEMALARLALDSRIPTFGICRGTQILNVLLGGTLFEHLPDHVGEDVLHRLPPREPTEHAVTLERESRLAEILGAVELRIASWHHQAIRNVAPGLTVVARAPDGTIEADAEELAREFGILDS